MFNGNHGRVLEEHRQLWFQNFFSWGCLHEISLWANLNNFSSVSGQFFVTFCVIQPEMKLTAGVTSLRSLWQKWNFVPDDTIFCKDYPKWNHVKENICTCFYFIKTKMIGFYRIDRFSWNIPEKKFDLISPAMKSNVNKISFMVGWNFISGRFYFGP